jgi:hypothetical protein
VEIAAVVKPIAVVLSILSSAYGLLRLVHWIRFRKPLFHVEEGELPVKEHSGLPLVGPGHFVLNARGASRPTTLTEQQVFFSTEATQMGGQGVQKVVDIPPYKWGRITVPVELAFGIAPAEMPPEEMPVSLRADIVLSNPRDAYVIPVRLTLKKDRSMYVYYADWPWIERHYRHTQQGVRARLRQFARIVSRAHLR